MALPVAGILGRMLVGRVGKAIAGLTVGAKAHGNESDKKDKKKNKKKPKVPKLGIYK